MDAERNALMLRPAPSVAQPTGRLAVLSLPTEHAGSARGRLTLYRPSDAQADFSLPLALDGNGQQRVSLERVVAGHWILKVRWSAGTRDYYFERPVLVQ